MLFIAVLQNAAANGETYLLRLHTVKFGAGEIRLELDLCF